MRRSGAVRAGSFAVVPGGVGMARRDLVARLEQRVIAASRELEAIREDLARLVEVAVSRRWGRLRLRLSSSRWVRRRPLWVWASPRSMD
jgi:hypothetical protein